MDDKQMAQFRRLSILFPFIVLFILLATSLYGQEWVARHGLTTSQYEQEFNKWVGLGYRLKDVSGYAVGNSACYAAIWEKTTGAPWAACYGLTSSEFQQEFDYWVGQGYRLTRVNGYEVDGNAYFAAIWENKAGPAWVARYDLTSSQFQQEFNNWVGQGYRLTWVSGYAQGIMARYAGIWEQTTGSAWVARHGMTSSQFQQEFNNWVGQGYRLTCVSGYTVAGQDYFAAIWEQTGGPYWAARYGIPAADYQGIFDQLFFQGCVPVQIDGYPGDGNGRFAAIWESRGYEPSDLQHIYTTVETFMQEYDIPGLSIAITKNERLVFARGFGYADKDENIWVNPSHLFRIASVSKPITSIAILTLAEKGKLSLSDRVFGVDGILGIQYGLPLAFPQKGDMTVEQLLEHTGGGWPNDHTDPMFQRYDLDQTDLIKWTLQNYTLAYAPGDHFAYSNFGYLLLGRVIEKTSGQPYEDYVKSAVLSQAAVSNIHIAGDTLAERHPNEVVYYDSEGGDPYGVAVSRMDSHGGWIASPIELLRLLVRVDGFLTKPDILNPDTITNMTTGSSVNPYYAKGWAVNPANNWWHTGLLPGSYSELVRAQNGFCWAILVNKKRSTIEFYNDVDQLGWTILNGVGFWPSYDLFTYTSCWFSGDFNVDNDVDASDLALLAAQPDLLDLSVFAEEFGESACLR